MMRNLLRFPGLGGRRSRRRRELITQIAFRVAELYEVGGGRTDRSAPRVDEVAELEFALAVLDGLPPVETPAADAGPAAAPPGQGPPEIVLKLVRIHDWLDMAADRDAESAPLIKRFRHDVVEMLGLSGAALVDEDGPVRAPHHEVISAVPTGDPALVHHVARTLRPGVRWNGRLIRPQQVVAYVEERR